MANCNRFSFENKDKVPPLFPRRFCWLTFLPRLFNQWSFHDVKYINRRTIGVHVIPWYKWWLCLHSKFYWKLQTLIILAFFFNFWNKIIAKYHLYSEISPMGSLSEQNIFFGNKSMGLWINYHFVLWNEIKKSFLVGIRIC
jgi:hypothetical protein